ncbi:uncharacterized protein DS421_12g381430 [Arachis hypogaea]|nr:uncharacterized protein DS421_12g381430 [Arachis hypogaea]
MVLKIGPDWPIKPVQPETNDQKGYGPLLIIAYSKTAEPAKNWSVGPDCAAAVRAVCFSAPSLVTQALSCSSASSFPLSPSSLASLFEVGAARRPCLRRRTEKENGNLNQQTDFRSVSACSHSQEQEN